MRNGRRESVWVDHNKRTIHTCTGNSSTMWPAQTRLTRVGEKLDVPLRLNRYDNNI